MEISKTWPTDLQCQWDREREGERDRKDFILLFLAGDSTFRVKQPPLYMESISEVVWLFCNQCTNGWNLSHRGVSGAATTSWSKERTAWNLGLSAKYKEITILSTWVIWQGSCEEAVVIKKKRVYILIWTGWVNVAVQFSVELNELLEVDFLNLWPDGKNVKNVNNC